MDILNRIKRLIVRRRYRFTVKALDELDADGLTRNDVLEAILNAQAIKKTLRSRSPHRGSAREKLYVIESFNFGGTLIYTKGKIANQLGKQVYYVLISSKRPTLGDFD